MLNETANPKAVCPVCKQLVDAQWPRKGDGHTLRLKKHNKQRMALISNAIRPYNELCEGSMKLVKIEVKDAD